MCADVKNRKATLCRPQSYLVDRCISGKPFRIGKRQPNWNWQRMGRHISDPLARIYSHIHYLTSHAPRMVQRRWKQAEVRLKNRMRWYKAGINDRI